MSVVVEKTAKAIPRTRFKGFSDDWSVCKLKDIAAIKGRIGFRGYTVSDLVPAGEGALTIGAKHIGLAGRLSLEEPTYLSWEKYNESPEIMIEPGDILFVQRGSLGMTALVDELPGPATINPSMVIIRVSDADHEFIYQTLSGPKVQKEVEQISTATAVPMISQGQIGSFSIPLPTLPEQQKIAAFLGAVDRKIQQLKRKQALLEQYKKGVVQQLFAQELRFKRKDGGEFSEWEEKRLGDISTSFSGGTPRTGTPEFYDGDIPFIRSAEINADRTELFLTQEGLDNCSAKRVKKGDLLYAMYGATAGEIGISRIDGAINQAILCIRLKKDVTYYVYSYMQYRKERILASFLQGGQGNLSGAIVNDTIIPLPSLEEQTRIAGFLMALDAKVAGVAQAVAAAQRWKKGLLQQMFV